MALGGVAGAMLGTHLVFNISQVVLKRMFAVFIIITGIHMFIKSYAKPAQKEPPQTDGTVIQSNKPVKHAG
jgi:uncharacterized membrane protein YfcA